MKINIIGIDVSLIHRNAGMGNHLKSTLPALLTDKSIKFYLFSCSKKSLNLIENGENIKKIYFPFDKIGFDKQNPIFEQIVLPILISFNPVNKFFFPYNTMPFIKLKDYKSVVLVHDLIYLKSTKEIPLSKSIIQIVGRYYRKFFVSSTIKKANKIITVTNFSKEEIYKYFPTLDKNKVEVIYNSINPGFFTRESNKEVLDRYNIKEKSYFVSLLAHDPRKNNIGTLKSFSKLLKENKDFKLVFVGVKDYQKTEAYSFVNKSELKLNVVFTGFINLEDLIDLYTYSSALIYPSIEEGFGLPVMEAMSRKTPVITSITTSTKEVSEGKAILINPTEIDQIFKAMNEVVKEGKLINEAYQVALKYRSNDSGEKYLNLLKNI